MGDGRQVFHQPGHWQAQAGRQIYQRGAKRKLAAKPNSRKKSLGHSTHTKLTGLVPHTDRSSHHCSQRAVKGVYNPEDPGSHLLL